MPKLLVHIEGVNFETTITDVNDLATQRGASLALLEAPRALIEAVAGKLISASLDDEVFTAASVGRYILQTTETDETIEARLRKLAVRPSSSIGELKDVLPHLSFAVAAVTLNDDADVASARRHVVAKAKRAQLQAPTVVAPKPVCHTKLCELNPSLPAASTKDRYSASVHARREYGRARKQGFYKSLGITLPCRAIFAREIDDLVRDGPKHLPGTVYNKVAHVYLDGNDFTRIRETAISNADKPLETEKRFSKFVATRRERLLKRLVEEMGKCGDMFVEVGDTRVFRWETLLWGGDEAAFVMPAWALPRLLPLLAEELATCWTFEGTELTHKSGIFIADRKTPIALARRLAEALADSAKLGGKNTTQIMVSESVDPPVDITRIDKDALSEYRKDLFGAGSPEYFTLDLDQIKDFVKGLRTVQEMPGGLPRSQLYSLLRVGGPDPKTALERSGASCAHVFEKPCFGAGSSDELLPYRRVAELLDYFPLEDA